MSVNLGHPAGHAHFFQVSMIVSEGRENIGIIVASSVDHFEEAIKRFSDCPCRLPSNKTGLKRSRMTSLQAMQYGT